MVGSFLFSDEFQIIITIQGADLGFLEMGFICFMVWRDRFSDFIWIFKNGGWKGGFKQTP